LITVRPSKLDLVSHCPAAILRSSSYPFEDNSAAARGRDLHQRVANALRTVPRADDVYVDGLNEEDAKAVRTCLEVADSLRPRGPHKTYIEDPVNLMLLGIPQGTPDLVYFDEESETICVIDWKFGGVPVPDPMDNKQLFAYVLGHAYIREWLFKQAHLVVCQPDAYSGAPYKSVTIPAAEFTEYESNIKRCVQEAIQKTPPASAGPWCKRGFCEACKHEDCPEYKAWSEKNAEEKQEAKVQTALAATSGFDPIKVAGIPGPIVILDAAVLQKAEEYRSKALSMAVTDQESANEVGLFLGEVTKFEGQVELSRQTVKAPVLELGKVIDSEARKALEPLQEAKAGMKARLKAWMDEENAKRERERQEAERKIREAQDAQRKAEEESRKAQQEALNATTKVAREEAARKVAEAEAARTRAQVASQVSFVEPAPAKVAGVKSQKVPEFTIPDISKVPMEYLQVNESVVMAAIKSGKWGKDKPAPEWLTVKWVEKTSSTGRR
jgi:hypothetical protein